METEPTDNQIKKSCFFQSITCEHFGEEEKISTSGLPSPVFVFVFTCVFVFVIVIVIVIVKWKSVNQWAAILCLLQALQVVSQVHTCVTGTHMQGWNL